MADWFLDTINNFVAVRTIRAGVLRPPLSPEMLLDIGVRGIYPRNLCRSAAWAHTPIGSQSVLLSPDYLEDKKLSLSRRDE